MASAAPARLADYEDTRWSVQMAKRVVEQHTIAGTRLLTSLAPVCSERGSILYTVIVEAPPQSGDVLLLLLLVAIIYVYV